MKFSVHPKGALCLLLFFVSLLAARAVSAQSADKTARVTLEFDKPTYFLGENALAHFTVTNTGTKPLTLGDLTVIAHDSTGKKLAAPVERIMTLGIMMQVINTVHPGRKFTQSLPLHGYLRFDSAGKFTVRVRQNMWTTGMTKPLSLAADAKINFIMPTPEQAKQVVEEMARLPEYYGGESADKTPPYTDFSALRYPVYLPMLKERFAKGGDTEYKLLEAIGHIRTPEATQTLIALLSHRDKYAAEKAFYWLAHRLPLTESEAKNTSPFGAKERAQQKEYAKDAWRPEFAPAVRAYARKQLLSRNHETLRLGADAIERIGSKEDMPALLLALNNVIARITKLWRVPGIDENSDEPFNVEQDWNALLSAAQSLIKCGASLPSPEGRPAEIAVFLRVAANIPALRPRDWQARQLKLLRHPSPFIRYFVLDTMEFYENAATRGQKVLTMSPALISLVPRLLADPDIHVRASAVSLVAARKERRFLPFILRTLRTSKDRGMLGSMSSAAMEMGAHYEVWQIWAARLDEPGMSGAAIQNLMQVVKNQTGAGWDSDPDLKTARRLKKEWQRFLTVHRARLKAKQLFSVDDPALKPALAPPSYHIYSGKKMWPPRR